MTTEPLSLTQAAALLRAGIATLRAEAEALGVDAMRWHPAEGEWCVNEVIGHVLEAERRGFAGRIRLILEQPGRKLETWDQVEIERACRDCQRNGMELLRELEAERAESIALVQSLRDEQLGLSGEHPDVGALTIRALLHEWPHHDREHIKQAMSNAQARVWPHMENARRFSEID